jgi:hypothetical protein
MGSLMGRITQLARSRQGKQAMERAQRMARDPATRQRINDARSRLGKRRGGAQR